MLPTGYDINSNHPTVKRAITLAFRLEPMGNTVYVDSGEPTPGFLTLQYNAYSRADSDGRHGNCAEYVHLDLAKDTWRSGPLLNDPAVGSSGMWFAPEDTAVGSKARRWWGSSDYSVLRVQMYDESESTRHATLVIRARPPPPCAASQPAP